MIEHMPASGPLQSWLRAAEQLDLPATPDPARLEADAAHARRIFSQGWEMLERLPLRSARGADEKRLGETIVRAMADLCYRFCRAHRRAIYARLTGDFTCHVRVDDLVYRAAELWPGLVPTAAEIARESEQLLKDKDGREIQQGMFLAQMLSGRDTGTHMLVSMLQPTAGALERLDEFVEKGVIDLGNARVEARGEVGWIYFTHLRSLNSEDDETALAWETAVDLVLLHPGLRIGVLRGDPVEHPRYKGRRIFSSGLNLTRLYHGKLPFLFYMVRDMGFVNKMYRGHASAGYRLDEPEDTHEKPWVAVVDTFAIGGGCQILLVMDYVLAESGAYFNLPARKEGIIPGVANLRLPRFMGERLARHAILFDRTFHVDSPEARAVVNEVHPRERLDEAVERMLDGALSCGMASAAGNRKAIRVQTEPLDRFREFMAVNAREQAFNHLSDQLVSNLENFWSARERKL
jgi:thioesterase DpgC